MNLSFFRHLQAQEERAAERGVRSLQDHRPHLLPQRQVRQVRQTGRRAVQEHHGRETKGLNMRCDN